MNKIKTLFLVALMGITLTSEAQYTQLGKSNEFMLKIEAGYGPFMTNSGTPDVENGYNLNKYHHMANANIMAGANISQDWFLGAGGGFCYFFNLKQETAESYMGATAFVDFDFRPVWKAIMGLDYQPTSIKWAPMIGGRLGGSALFTNDTPLITPMGEIYGGINWYYWYHLHGMRNMTRTWHSFYATIGVAYMQQTFFLPIRLGWRW